MTREAVDPAKYAAAKDGVLDLILNEADKRIGAQVQLMLAADGRAAGILSGCVGLASGGIGFAVSQLTHREALFWAALAFGVTDSAAAILALWALWPEQVRPQGWSPERFGPDLGKTKPQIQSEIAKFLQQRIDWNRDRSRKLSGRIKAAMLIVSLSPLVGLSAGLCASALSDLALVAALAALAVFLWLGLPLLPRSAEDRST